VPIRVHALADDAGRSKAMPIGSGSEWRWSPTILADRHARARAFGSTSQLSTSFPSAVKTGTSSDFRDTWTVVFHPRLHRRDVGRELRRHADAAP